MNPILVVTELRSRHVKGNFSYIMVLNILISFKWSQKCRNIFRRVGISDEISLKNIVQFDRIKGYLH